MPFFREFAELMEVPDLELFWSIYAGFWAVMLSIGAVLYVIHSLSLFAIAKRRGIRKPWLSWIPVGDMWVLGSISDQYQYVVKGRVRNRRKVLLGTGLVVAALGIAAMAMAFGVMAQVLKSADSGYMDEFEVVRKAIAMWALCVVMGGFGIWSMVYCFLSYYDLYASCNPDTKTVFLVLSVIFQFVIPFFLFADRKKDYGMPPRTDSCSPYPAPESLDI